MSRSYRTFFQLSVLIACISASEGTAQTLYVINTTVVAATTKDAYDQINDILMDRDKDAFVRAAMRDPRLQVLRRGTLVYKVKQDGWFLPSGIRVRIKGGTGRYWVQPGALSIYRAPRSRRLNAPSGAFGTNAPKGLHEGRGPADTAEDIAAQISNIKLVIKDYEAEGKTKYADHYKGLLRELESRRESTLSRDQQSGMPETAPKTDSKADNGPD